MEGVGGLAFFVFLAGGEMGEHGEKGKGLRPGFEVSKCSECLQRKGKAQTGAASRGGGHGWV